MSAMRATGMKSATPFGPAAWSGSARRSCAGRSGPSRRARSCSRRPADRSGPASRRAPRPSRPAARRARRAAATCDDRDQRARRAAIRRASRRIVSAGDAAIAAAQSASFGWPSSRPEQVALEDVEADAVAVQESRGRAVPRSPGCARAPSIIATSVPGPDREPLRRRPPPADRRAAGRRARSRSRARRARAMAAALDMAA